MAGVKMKKSAAELGREIVQSEGRPERLFAISGTTVDERLESLRDAYLAVLRVVHPDHDGGRPRAHEATSRLIILNALAISKIEAGTWGQATGPAVAFTLGGKPARLEDLTPLCRGDFCDLYRARLEPGDRQVVVKLARRAADNDLLATEARVLADRRGRRP